MHRKRFMLGLALVLLATPLWAQEPAVNVLAFAQDTLKNDSDAQGQTSLLIRHIGPFTAKKVDVSVLGTNDEQAVVPAVQQAYQAGIAVIVLDSGIKGQDDSSFIHSDNIQIGALGAEFLARELKGKGQVLLFEGLQTADVTQLRREGFLDVMAKHPGIKVIKRTGNYLRKDALLEMDQLLAQGTRGALQNHKVDPKSILMVGCDYASEARDAIRQGTQTGSVLFPLEGEMSVDVARKWGAKELVAQHVVIPVKLITRDNVEQNQPIF